MKANTVQITFSSEEDVQWFVKVFRKQHRKQGTQITGLWAGIIGSAISRAKSIKSNPEVV